MTTGNSKVTPLTFTQLNVEVWHEHMMGHLILTILDQDFVSLLRFKTYQWHQLIYTLPHTQNTPITSAYVQICLSPYHMVAAEGLHDRCLIQELDSLSQACRLIHRLHCYTRVSFSLDDVLGNALVDHAEGALTQFPQNVDLVSGHLPLVLLIHCRNISRNAT